MSTTSDRNDGTYDPAADPVHGSGWNSAARWGGWHWSEPRHGEHFRRCSFCGSIDPDDLAAEPTWRADWADRKYVWPHKFYVDVPNRDPAALFVVGAQSGGQGRPGYRPPEPLAGEDGIGWVAFADLTRAQRKIAGRDGWRVTKDDHSDFYEFGTRSSHYGKFYTIHLADPQVTQEAKDIIGRVSGLRFRFEDGRMSWEAWADS